MFFIPGQHSEHGLTHSPLKALISPRPIGWISSVSAEGIANLSPYSFFNAIAEFPPMVMFISAPDAREGNQNGHKDSFVNIMETREFGVNIVGSAQAEQMVASSRTLPPQIDEFEHAGLEKMAARKIGAPLVAGAPAHLECVYYDHVTLPDNGKGGHSIMVMGHIVGIHIDQSIVKDGLVDVTGYEPVSRLGYMDYAKVTDVFSMKP